MLDVPLASRGLQLFPSMPGKGGLYISGWSVAEALEARFLTPFLPSWRFPRESMLLRALQDAGDPWIARAQYACPCHSRHLPLLVHKLAHMLEGSFVSVPRDD